MNLPPRCRPAQAPPQSLRPRLPAQSASAGDAMPHGAASLRLPRCCLPATECQLASIPQTNACSLLRQCNMCQACTHRFSSTLIKRYTNLPVPLPLLLAFLWLPQRSLHLHHCFRPRLFFSRTARLKPRLAWPCGMPQLTLRPLLLFPLARCPGMRLLPGASASCLGPVLTTPRTFLLRLVAAASDPAARRSASCADAPSHPHAPLARLCTPTSSDASWCAVCVYSAPPASVARSSWLACLPLPPSTAIPARAPHPPPPLPSIAHGARPDRPATFIRCGMHVTCAWPARPPSSKQPPAANKRPRAHRRMLACHRTILARQEEV